MSPEQAQGKTLTPASDQYSLAVILYEVLTGKLPFEAKSAMDYLALHVTGTPTPLSLRVAGKTFPKLLDEIIARCLSKNVGDRFASMSDLSVALQAVLEGKRELPQAVTPHPAHTETQPMPAESQAAARNASSDADMPMEIPKSNMGLLIGVAVAFLLAGVLLTVVGMALLKK
jgi:serine/threonine-protein kinase